MFAEDFIDGLTPLLAAAPLQDVHFCSLGLGASAAAARLLSRSSTLRSLSLYSYMGFSADAGSALGSLLRSSTCQLAHLELGAPDRTPNFWRGDDCVTSIAAALQHNNTLVFLSLGQVKLGPDASAALADAVARSTTLRVLDLRSFSLDLARLFVGVRGSRLEELRMHTDYGDQSWRAAGAELSKALSDERTALLKLSIEQCPMHLMSVVKGLGRNESLRKLKLASFPMHRCTDAATGAICKALVFRNASLEKLELCDVYGARDRTSTATAQSLVTAFCSGRLTALKELSVRRYHFGDDLTCQLAVAISEHAPQLETLWLDDCGFGTRGAVALARMLTSHASLLFLSVDDNSIGYDGACALADAWPINGTLARLSVQRCKIGSAGVEALFDADVKCPLASLDVDQNEGTSLEWESSSGSESSSDSGMDFDDGSDVPLWSDSE